jgi:integrase
MATIVKTPSGTWKAVIRKTGWPTSSKTFRTKRDAEDWARRTEDEMVRGVYIRRAPGERMTLESALNRYLREVTPTKRESTRVPLSTKKHNRCSSTLGNTRSPLLAPISSHSTGTCGWPAILTKKGKLVPRSNTTVRLELALLSHLFTIAIKEWGLGLPFNPVSQIRRPAPGAGRNRRLTLAENKRLLAAVDAYSNPMFSWIVRIALETGMRLSEIGGLRLGQVDLQKRVVRLDITKNSSPRTVPLTKAATTAFQAAMDNPTRPPETDLVFFGEPGRDGVRRPYLFDKAWTDAKKEAGLTDFRFHDLRHEAVSRLVEAGLSDQEVAAISGHKSMQMLKRYTHLRAEDLVGKLDKLSN